MKILHIYKTEPDDTTKTLSAIVSEGKEITEFPLYQGEPDYGQLIDLIFEHDHDNVISWW
jgi:hypothetical protein